MRQIDHLDLDGHLLQLLLAVYEEQSVTRAALRLGVTQSAVSHGLDKLRVITGDPLFVRAGRSITATSKAALMADRARALLADMQAFSAAAGFDPARLQMSLTVAANDLQRDLLLPRLLRRLRAQAPGLSMRILPSGAPSPAMLREGPCQLIITPRPPLASDIMQQRLLTDRFCVYFDASQRQAPENLADYLASEHVSVEYEPGRMLDMDHWLESQQVHRRMVATVPGFAALRAMLHGSTWLATAPARLLTLSMHGLAVAEPPLNLPTLPMFMVWHQRQQNDPVHAWIRSELLALVNVKEHSL